MLSLSSSRSKPTPPSPSANGATIYTESAKGPRFAFRIPGWSARRWSRRPGSAPNQRSARRARRPDTHQIARSSVDQWSAPRGGLRAASSPINYRFVHNWISKASNADGAAGRIECRRRRPDAGPRQPAASQRLFFEKLNGTAECSSLFKRANSEERRRHG
jgi:hypothetical protein